MINKSNRILSTSLALKKNRFESKAAAMPCFSAAILAIKTVFFLQNRQDSSEWVICYPQAPKTLWEPHSYDLMSIARLYL